MRDAVRIGRWTALGMLGVGYAALAHYTNASPQGHNLGALLALAPLLAIALTLAWRSPQRVLMLALTGICCAMIVLNWRLLALHFDFLYWIQHAGMQAMLGVAFGRTLLSGREPMCTFFARIVHGGMTPPLARYTRQVTIAWTLFFALMTLASALLFFAAPLVTWSFFANFLTLPLVALMFLGEYAMRRRVLPDLPPAHILDAVKAFWNPPAR